MANEPTQVQWPTGGLFGPFDKVRDRVSGWSGQITAEYRYANGCLRYEVAGADKDGKPEGFVVDVEQLDLVERAQPIAQPQPTGGARGSRPVARR